MSHPQPDPGLSHGVLLQQVSWIRRLARELVADRDLAEDLVQETCVAALEHSPRDGSQLRRWLASILRNALRQHVRGQGRRVAREQGSARDEGLESTAELVERVALQRVLVGAVLELEEPYRSTVLLRFFEELPPREIARRTSVPVATVHSRLQRALARLRARLDGEQRAWAVLFLPLARGFEPLGPPTLLTLVMKTKLVLAATLTLVAAGALVWWQTPGDAGERGGVPVLAAAPETLAQPPAPAGVPAAESPGTVRVPVDDPRPSVVPDPRPGEPASEPLPWTVRARVLDAEGRPLSGLALRSEDGGEVLGTSGGGGWCLFETHAEHLRLVVADPGWVTVHQGSARRSSAFDPVVVVAPEVELGGLVVDEPGRPLAGARVRLVLPADFHTRFGEVLEATRTRQWIATSSPDGRFSLEQVPAVSGATLVAVLAGYEADEIEEPDRSRADLELVLFRPRALPSGVLRGTVVDPDGLPVSEARVGLGLVSVLSDERGEFVIELSRAVTSETLIAVKAGFLPARMERPDVPEESSSGWPEHVRLVLGGPPLSIRGVVLDEEREPLPRARVWLHDMTPAAPVGRMPVHLEPLMAGAPVPMEALESESRLPERDGDDFWDEISVAGAPSALWHWVETDGSGAFELGGLDERNYRLDVLRPDSLEVVTSESFPAGTRTAEIRLGPPQVFETVTARVLSEEGFPVEGVRARLYRPVIDVRGRVFGGTSEVILIERGEAQVSDGEGLVRFREVPREGARLSCSSDEMVPITVDVSSESLEIRVELRCHLDVELREPLDRYDALAVADGSGKRLDVLILTEGSVTALSEVPLVNGRSGVVSVSSRARELRLFKDGALIDTLPLELLPGEVNRVEP